MKKKKTLIIILAAVLVAVILAVLLIFKPFEDKTVKVVPVSALASTDYSSLDSELSGTVREEGYQSVFISDTQKVNEVYVSPGQQVEAGEALLSYDTTLTQIQLDKSAIDIQKLKLELQKAQKELDKINNLEPSSEKLIEPDNSWIKYEPVETPYFLTGSGTMEEPYYFIIDESDIFDETFFRALELPEKSDTDPGSNLICTVFLIRENNAVNGEIEESYGFEVLLSDESFSFKPYTPIIPDEIADYDEPEEPYYEKEGSEYTAAEIAKMKAEQETVIRNLNRQIQIAELEYQKDLLELSDNVVRAKEAGTIQSVSDPETAYKNGEPLILISSGGGLYLDVQVSELALDTVKPGETVKIFTMDRSEEFEGKVQSISDMPAAAESNMYFDGNSNVSYYPVTISLPEDKNLRADDFLTVSISGEALAENTFFLENMFLLNERGHSYVYAENNGKLEKREIKTGQNMYGYSTQIREGLSLNDYIAFPYGKQVKDGAPTKHATTAELYQ